MSARENISVTARLKASSGPLSRIGWASAVLILSAVAPVMGTDYFVAPSGDDAGPGTATRPWETLAKANEAVRPGDAVVFRDGVYAGIISPSASGRSDEQQVIYRSENRRGAVLVGQPAARYIVNLTGKRFITVDGFKMLPREHGFGRVEGCDHITIQNCHLEHSTQIYCPLEFINSHRNRLLDNRLVRCISRTRYGKIHGDMCHFIDSSYNVIEGNDFARIGHSPLRIWATSPHGTGWNVIRGNCFHNGWGRNFEMFNLDRSLFEANIVADAFNGASSADADGKVFLADGIFRRCLICDNWDSPLASNSYIDRNTTGEVPLELSNTRIYNNTFVNNPVYVWRLDGRGGNPIRANQFVNNLFCRNGYTGDFDTLVLGNGCGADNDFSHNLFYGEKPGQAGIRLGNKRYTAEVLNQELAIRCQNNRDADPRLLSLNDRCFALDEGSPARDAGRILTRTIDAGTGNEMRVLDARWFYDGFGIEGEQGDLIVAGKEKSPARVLKADIENNILVLDRDLQWEGDVPVSLPYAGTKPDIGAFEQGDTGILTVVLRAQPAVAAPGEPVALSALVSGAKGAVKFAWDLGDETFSGEAAIRHSYRSAEDYVVRLRCTDASGLVARGMILVRVEPTSDPTAPLMQTSFEESDFEEWGYLWDHGPSREEGTYYPELRDDGKGNCMCVSTAAGNKSLACNVKLRSWAIDRYPQVRFSYRIPSGVPVGVWLDAWPSDGRSERTCLGGSPAHSSGSRPDLAVCKLLDDGKWHVAEIDARVVRQVAPNLTLLHAFEFSTYGPTTEGQKFWFDDFGITP